MIYLPLDYGPPEIPYTISVSEDGNIIIIKINSPEEEDGLGTDSSSD